MRRYVDHYGIGPWESWMASFPKAADGAASLDMSRSITAVDRARLGDQHEGEARRARRSRHPRRGERGGGETRARRPR
jgi:hypothetical protein